MGEAERVRMREPDPSAENPYENQIKFYMGFRERNMNGQLVVREEEREWRQTRQGRLKYILMREFFPGTVNENWAVFLQDIKRHSGRHKHQGGIVIYVLEGRGRTEVDGEVMEWEEGDLIVLPLKPGGVEHQHFNADEQNGCKWIAFIYMPWQLSNASAIEQKEPAAGWQDGGT